MASDAVVNLIVNADDAETRVNAQLRRIADDAERRAPDISLNVTIDNSGVIAALNDQTDRLGDSLDDVNHVLNQISGQLDELAASGSLRQVGDDADDADRSVSRLSGSVNTLAGGLGRAVFAASRLTVLAGVASQALPAVAALATSVESLVPAGAALVSAFLTARAAALTLKLGLVGVDEAIGAVFDPNADPEALAEALENLSDNARDFVLELRDMRPALDDLRLDVQDRLFKNLDSTLRTTADAVLPDLTRAARNFADTFNDMAQGVGAEARDLGNNGTLGRALSQGTDAFAKLERIPGQALTAIVQLAAAGGPLLNRLTDRIVSLADSASDALSDAFESGRLEDSVNSAGDTISQLGRIAGNVFGSLGNIMDIASDSGVGLFDTLERVTQALEDVTASDEFQKTLTALLDVGAEVADAVLPLLLEAFQALAPVIQILAPYVQQIVELLGDQLAELIPELAPVLVELAQVFGEILIAIQPLIERGIQLLIDLMPDLIPLFQEIQDLVVALSPLIEYLAVGLEFLLGEAINIVLPLLTFFVIGLQEIIKFVDITLQWLARFVGFLEGQTSTAIESVSLLLDGRYRESWDSAATGVTKNSLTMAQQVESMSQRVTASTATTGNNVRDHLSRGFSEAVTAVNLRTFDIAASVNNLRIRLVQIVLDIAGAMYRAGANIMSSLADGIISQIAEVTSSVNTVVGAIRDFFPSSPAKRGPFSGRGYPFYSGQEVIASFARGIISQRVAAQVAIDAALRKMRPFGPAATDPLSGIVGTGTEFAGIANTTFARLTPNVNVFIGNQALVGYIQTVVEDDTADRDRLASQGTR